MSKPDKKICEHFSSKAMGYRRTNFSVLFHCYGTFICSLTSNVALDENQQYNFDKQTDYNDSPRRDENIFFFVSLLSKNRLVLVHFAAENHCLNVIWTRATLLHSIFFFCFSVIFIANLEFIQHRVNEIYNCVYGKRANHDRKEGRNNRKTKDEALKWTETVCICVCVCVWYRWWFMVAWVNLQQNSKMRVKWETHRFRLS